MLLFLIIQIFRNKQNEYHPCIFSFWDVPLKFDCLISCIDNTIRYDLKCFLWTVLVRSAYPLRASNMTPGFRLVSVTQSLGFLCFVFWTLSLIVFRSMSWYCQFPFDFWVWLSPLLFFSGSLVECDQMNITLGLNDGTKVRITHKLLMQTD